jgi:SAM-dependent methyltransferase
MLPSSSSQGACGLCGARSEFAIQQGLSLREARCGECGASRRNADVAAAILATFVPEARAGLRGALPDLASLSVFEAQASGPIHEVLKVLPGYVCAEYLDGVAPGEIGQAGVRCEDLERLSFPDESFDLVVTQDVFEHVRDPDAGFREASRVLRPRGWHVFTVPVHEGHPTRARLRRHDGREVGLEPPVHHADPLRDAGSVVCTDFGDDLPDLLEQLGIPAELAIRHAFYEASEIPWVYDEASYAEYRVRTGPGSLEALLGYFRYNSIVYRAGKIRRG